MLNANDIKTAALLKKDIAKAKIEKAKIDAANRKILQKNPVPSYIDKPVSTGNAEIDSDADLTELQSGFRKRAADESKRFGLATDSEYWACICFQTRDQKEAFLTKLDIMKFSSDKIEGRYFDGISVAQQLGIDLPKADVPYKTSEKVSSTWLEFVNK